MFNGPLLICLIVFKENLENCSAMLGSRDKLCKYFNKTSLTPLLERIFNKNNTYLSSSRLYTPNKKLNNTPNIPKRIKDKLYLVSSYE